MRIALDLVVGINAAAGVVGLMVRHFRRSRRAASEAGLTHSEYQAKLRRENNEIDDERKRLGL